jgi:predicted nucleotidyltransferase component of viral defense system
MQYVVLESIASVPSLAGLIVFKGGNALRFIYGNRRSTLDLDFTARGAFPDDSERIRAHLDEALRFAFSRFRVKAKCQRVKRNPRNPAKTTPTYDISVGYLLPTDRQYQNFDELQSVAATIDVEISINEVVCEAVAYELYPEGRILYVCSLEDILAEKLRALLQQPIRKRSRPQDVFDIASMIRQAGGGLDLAKVSDFLLQKAAARDIQPRKGSFDDIVRALAVEGYDAQIGPNTPDFIIFDEAWSQVLEFVSKLEIPD